MFLSLLFNRVWVLLWYCMFAYPCYILLQLVISRSICLLWATNLRLISKFCSSAKCFQFLFTSFPIFLDWLSFIRFNHLEFLAFHWHECLLVQEITSNPGVFYKFHFILRGLWNIYFESHLCSVLRKFSLMLI